MEKINFTNCRLFPLLFLLIPFFISCSRNHRQSPTQKIDSAAIRKAHASPVLSPTESLHHFKLANGFDIQLAAAEPLVRAPVSIKFDAKGRIWVVEMQGYMPDTAGTGETTRPAGKIVILSDKNSDGLMDRRKVFMDSLILPRAIGFYEDGVLVGEPPNLWFVENNHGSAGKKQLVDNKYAVRGNVEHQPNGLLRGMDNWVYSANAAKRYRKIDGSWVVQRTHLRGQWGITQDNFGRLFYNNNSANLLGDYFLPGLGAWNPNQQEVRGFNENIVSDNRTYPIHPTPGVNRGYQPHVLDDSLRLTHFTAASGPVIYRGGIFGAGFEGNAFVAEPAGNLIKRNILQENGNRIEGKQAYQEKEFLASDSERFRPVELKTGPDGALYIVDMSRGIIQDVIYLTSYLKNEIEMRRLTHPLNRGRIYKVAPTGQPLSAPDLSHKSTSELVDLLDSPNSWVRKTAQRLITDQHKVEAEDLLRNNLTNDASLVGKIHAFWTLEGLGKLQKKDVQSFLQSEQPKLQQQAIAAAVSRMNIRNAGPWIKEGRALLTKGNDLIAPYAGFLAASAARYTPQDANDLLLDLAVKYKDNAYVSDAVISGLAGRENSFLDRFRASERDTASVFYHHLTKVIANSTARKKASSNKKVKFPKGQALFTTYCETCHGADGGGIRALGAPLNGSSWVTGDKQTLLSIVLFGLTGPIKVGGKMYRTPEVAGFMPGFGQNNQLSDPEVARILSYIRNAWGNQADAVDPTDVKQARRAHKGRQQPFTMDELKENY